MGFDMELLKGLAFNASLLLALGVVYEISYHLPDALKKYKEYINGILIGSIGIGIMAMPFVLESGIVFDTRSILISSTALVFGSIPALTAAVITIIYRIIEGGAGVFAGSTVIVVSAAIGLFWRKIIINKPVYKRWPAVYAFGIIVHLAMLLCMFLLPRENSLKVLQAISLPVMAIYPVATVLLCMLLLHQKQRSEAMDKIAEAESKYKSLFNNNHTIMFVIDPEDGRIIDTNSAAAEYYGWSIAELKQMKVDQLNMLTPEEIKSEIELAEKEKRAQLHFRHKKASGDIVDIEVYNGPIYINSKKFLYSIVHDISKRMSFENDLRKSENRFRMLVENAPDAIFIQTDTKFAFVNNAALKLMGASDSAELLGTSVVERFHPDFRQIVSSRIQKLNIEKLSVPNREEVMLMLDGTPVHTEISAVPINFMGKDGALVFVRDISERKKNEQIRMDMEIRLRHQQKLEAIGMLAGGVAHEINNPLNGILNYAELLSDDLIQDSESLKYLEGIVTETKRISVIVKNLLQFSRQEKQSHSYASITDIIDSTLSLIRTVIKKDQIYLAVDIEDDLPAIKCRSQNVQQVIMNLLTNARDALNEKYPGYDDDKIIILKCRKYTENDRVWFRITVEDHGCGIPEALYEKIYMPFFSTKPKDKGTGLGLSLSFGIVKDHHGKLYFETEQGKYTKFILELPADNGWENIQTTPEEI